MEMKKLPGYLVFGPGLELVFWADPIYMKWAFDQR
jgi:hypothetical protein